MRKARFLKTLAMVREIHNDYLIGKSSWDASINSFADRVRSVGECLLILQTSSLSVTTQLPYLLLPPKCKLHPLQHPKKPYHTIIITSNQIIPHVRQTRAKNFAISKTDDKPNKGIT